MYNIFCLFSFATFVLYLTNGRDDKQVQNDDYKTDQYGYRGMPLRQYPTVKTLFNGCFETYFLFLADVCMS